MSESGSGRSSSKPVKLTQKRVPFHKIFLGEPRTGRCVGTLCLLFLMTAAGIPLLVLGASGLMSGPPALNVVFRVPLCQIAPGATQNETAAAASDTPRLFRVASSDNEAGNPGASSQHPSLEQNLCSSSSAPIWMTVPREILEAGASYEPSVLLTHGASAHNLTLVLDQDGWTSSLFLNTPLTSFNLSLALAVPGHSTVQVVEVAGQQAAQGTNTNASCANAATGGCPFQPIESISEYTLPALLSSPFSLQKLPQTGLRLRLSGSVSSKSALPPNLLLRWSGAGVSESGMQTLIFFLAGLALVDVVPALLFLFVQRRRTVIGAEAQHRIADVIDVLTADERKALNL